MAGGCFESVSNPDLRIWDTKQYSPKLAFKLYRDSIAESPLPGTLEHASQERFQARMEAAAVKDGLVARVRCTPHVVVRDAADCRNSIVDGYNITYRLAGGSLLEQSGYAISGAPGDILVRDSSLPCRVTMESGVPNEIVMICVPRNTLQPLLGVGFEGVSIVKKRTPLANCLELLAQSLNSAAQEELACLYDACLALLPLELDQRMKADMASFASRADRLRLQILDEIERELANIDLSPEYIAQRFGISVRYVHKLFATTGDTCRNYILRRRLDQIRRELISRSPRQEPISSLAYRWGFMDVPTFNRAFKRQFGCTPTRLRDA